MKTQNKISILFWVNKTRKNAEGKAPIWCRVTLSGKRTEVSLDEYVSPNAWSGKKERVKGDSSDADRINTLIAGKRSLLLDYFSECKREETEITIPKIRSVFSKSEGDVKFGLCEIAESYLSRLENEVKLKTYAQGTLKNYYTTVKFLKEFVQIKLGKSDVDTRKLGASFIDDFKIFVTTMEKIKKCDKNGVITSKKKVQKCNHNGFVKHFERINSIIEHAMRSEIIDRDPFFLVEESTIEKDSIYLNEEELFKVESLDLPKEGLGITRDMFVFCCYTGLSFSDVIKLSPSEISLKLDSRKWIFTQRKKSNVDVLTPVLSRVKDILAFYTNLPSDYSSGRIFPSITNQAYNRNLKVIARMCGITKNFTSHSARHTFGTTICANNGVPIDTCAKMLGHTTLRMTQKYYRTMPERMSRDIDALEEKLNKRNDDNINKMKKINLN